MTTDCTAALEDLRQALLTGADPGPLTREHLAACDTCRHRLSAVAHGLDEAVADLDPAVFEAAARRQHRRRLGWRGLGVASALGLAVAVVTPFVRPSIGWDAGSGGAALALLFALLLTCGLAWALVRVPTRLGLYKRLRQGRQLSGVCLGLAEFSCTPVLFWRLAFLVLTWFGGVGIWLYVLADLCMPVHPEDRPNLWRFRFARWWRRLLRA